MRALFLLLAVSSSLVVCGCAKKVEPPPSQGRQIRAPGVDVTIDPEQGVDVQAPGVDVEVEREKAGDE